MLCGRLHISHHLMSVLHSTPAGCCEPEVGVTYFRSTATQTTRPCAYPSFLSVLQVSSFFPNSASFSLPPFIASPSLCPLRSSLWDELSAPSFCSVCSLPSFSFPEAFPCYYVPLLFSSFSVILVILSSFFSVLSASTVFRERVLLQKWPLHRRALEVRRGPRLCRRLRWGISLWNLQLWS